jgi:hypothetical protein
VEDAVRMIIGGLVIAALTLLSMWAGKDAARAQTACFQYQSWEQAQAANEANPFLGLDPDGNGIACDCLLNGFPC